MKCYIANHRLLIHFAKPYYTVRYVISYLCVYDICINIGFMQEMCKKCHLGCIMDKCTAWSTQLYCAQEICLKHQISYE